MMGLNKKKRRREHDWVVASPGDSEVPPELLIDPKTFPEICCPICLEAPHNAVLLVCASFEKGCRPFMCDTSHRHANCFDHFRKSMTCHDCHGGAAVGASIEENEQEQAGASRDRSAAASAAVRVFGVDIGQAWGGREISLRGVWAHNRPSSGNSAPSSSNQPAAAAVTLNEPSSSETSASVNQDTRVAEDRSSDEAGDASTLKDDVGQELSGERIAHLLSKVGVGGRFRRIHEKLKCPLCRCSVIGWKVLSDVRSHCNLKERSCAQEGCQFAGSYEALRIHARAEHPAARPSEADPTRLRSWRRLERQQEIGDVLSSIRASMPRARIVGDYVIGGESDEEGGLPPGIGLGAGGHDEDDPELPRDEGNLWTAVLLFHALGSGPSMVESFLARRRQRPLARRGVLGLPPPRLSLASPGGVGPFRNWESHRLVEAGRELRAMSPRSRRLARARARSPRPPRHRRWGDFDADLVTGTGAEAVGNGGNAGMDPVEAAAQVEMIGEQMENESEDLEDVRDVDPWFDFNDDDGEAWRRRSFRMRDNA